MMIWVQFALKWTISGARKLYFLDRGHDPLPSPYTLCNGETELSKLPILGIVAPHAPAGSMPLLPAKFTRQTTEGTPVYHPVNIPSISCWRPSVSTRRGPAVHPGRHADWPYAATVRTRPRRKVSQEWLTDNRWSVDRSRIRGRISRPELRGSRRCADEFGACRKDYRPRSINGKATNVPRRVALSFPTNLSPSDTLPVSQPCPLVRNLASVSEASRLTLASV